MSSYLIIINNYNQIIIGPIDLLNYPYWLSIISGIID
jgi:hypothetical protein